jgi:hypothetical protein
MARRRGGGGRQERTKSPASGGGVHRRAQQRGAPGPAQRAGLHPVAAGLQGRDAPRHPGAEADTAAHPKRGDNRRGAKGGPTGPARPAGLRVSDHTGSADETAPPARLERSGRRARSGRDGLRHNLHDHQNFFFAAWGKIGHHGVNWPKISALAPFSALLTAAVDRQISQRRSKRTNHSTGRPSHDRTAF